MIPRYTGFDRDAIARTEADHFWAIARFGPTDSTNHEGISDVLGPQFTSVH
jgi:hypothetical protein